VPDGKVPDGKVPGRVGVRQPDDAGSVEVFPVSRPGTVSPETFVTGVVTAKVCRFAAP
jgi:hypothetical protein